MPFDPNITDPLERIKNMWASFSIDDSWWDGAIVANARPYSAEVLGPTRCRATFILEVDQSICNRARNLHGGAAATCLDILTTMAMVPIAKVSSETQAAFWQFLGVSRSLNCTYLKPVPEGSTVAVVCDVANIGRRLATLRGEIRHFDPETQTISDEILVLGEHGKVNMDPPEITQSTKL